MLGIRPTQYIAKIIGIKNGPISKTERLELKSQLATNFEKSSLAQSFDLSGIEALGIEDVLDAL